MLNYIWSGMIFIGIIWAAVNGTMEETSMGILNSAKEAVSLSITMFGAVSLWNGILTIGEKAGIMEQWCRSFEPILNFLFPNIPKKDSARKFIAENMIANMLGLNHAATPAGLRAMQRLKELNSKEKEEASDEMCTFIIINISSLQLIPFNMLAYRNEYHSSNPMVIIIPALIATTCSTLAGAVYCKIKQKCCVK